MDALDRYMAETLTDNEYLRGDDCKSTRSYLRGWVGSLFRRGEGRVMNEDEIARAVIMIDQFVSRLSDGEDD